MNGNRINKTFVEIILYNLCDSIVRINCPNQLFIDEFNGIERIVLPLTKTRTDGAEKYGWLLFFLAEMQFVCGICNVNDTCTHKDTRARHRAN